MYLEYYINWTHQKQSSLKIEMLITMKKDIKIKNIIMLIILMISKTNYTFYIIKKLK
jgi:hypothetical protein